MEISEAINTLMDACKVSSCSLSMLACAIVNSFFWDMHACTMRGTSRFLCPPTLMCSPWVGMNPTGQDFADHDVKGSSEEEGNNVEYDS